MDRQREAGNTDDEGTADASVMTEGVGGMADLEPRERATVSDVDDENVPPDPERSPS